MAEVFLLGAGFSKAISNAMPLISDLTQEVTKRLKEPIPDSALASGDNLELWMSYLSQSQPWLSESENLRNRATSLKISQVVAEIVEECTSRALETGCPTWLMRLLWYWHWTRADVITLNYDVIVERAAADIQESHASSERVQCTDLYPVPMTPAAARIGAVLTNEPKDTFKLYKLHGSVNWFYSGRASFYGETIVYVPVTNWRLDSNLKRIEENHRRYTEDKVPLIIPPLFDKNQYFEHESVRTTWAFAGDALRKAKHVYCIGYSLPQTDIAIQMLLRSNIRQPIQLSVVNTDSESAKHYANIFARCPFRVVDDYVCEATLPKLASDLKCDGWLPTILHE